VSAHPHSFGYPEMKTPEGSFSATTWQVLTLQCASALEEER
jgi:hypothetical protein